MNKENLLTIGRTLSNSPVGELVLTVTDMEPSGIIVNGYNHTSSSEYSLSINEATMVKIGINRSKQSLEKFLNTINVCLQDDKYVLWSDSYALPKVSKRPTGQNIEDLLKNPDGLMPGLSLYQHLVVGLGELCKVKPNGTDAIEYLGNWLIANNPCRPAVIDEPIVTFDDSVDLPLPPARDSCPFEVSGFEVGTEISVRLNGYWYPGTIMKDFSNGTYEVKYIDAIHTVDKTSIRAMNNDSRSLQRGYIVSTWSAYGGKSVITKCNSDGTYEVWNFNSKALEQYKRSELYYEDVGNLNFNEKLAVGAPCEGYNHWNSSWLAATIKAVNNDDTCDIWYESGWMETLPRPLIRAISTVVSPATSQFNVNDNVVVNYKGTGATYIGTITACNSDNTYDILYDDGEIDVAVLESLIRLSVQSTETSPLEVNDKVEGNYKGFGKWYTGKIVEADNTAFKYSILYEDGETETNVPRNRIKQFDELVPVDMNTTISVEDKVHGNYRGRGKWYPGKVKGVRDDGAIDIIYDDGETETILDRSLIRRSSRSVPLNVNDVIEGNFKSLGKWWSGKITTVRDDGSYDILYDDGETEVGVSRECIRIKA